MCAETWIRPNASKKQWGPKKWDRLHKIAIGYPRRPSPADARVAYRSIWALVVNLPCAECREHAARYVTRNPPDLANTETLQIWAWRFHNAVNARLGKRLVSYWEYLRLYANELWEANCRDSL